MCKVCGNPGDHQCNCVYPMVVNRVVSSNSLFQGTHCAGQTGKMAKKNIPVRENTGNLEILPKHREFGLFKL